MVNDSLYKGLVAAEGDNWVLGVLESGDKVIVGQTPIQAQSRIGCTFRYTPSKEKKGQFDVLGYLYPSPTN